MKKALFLMCLLAPFFSCEFITRNRTERINDDSDEDKTEDYVEKTVNWPAWIAYADLNGGISALPNSSSTERDAGFEPAAALPDFFGCQTHSDGGGDVARARIAFERYLLSGGQKGKRKTFGFSVTRNGVSYSDSRFFYFGRVKKSILEKDAGAEFVKIEQKDENVFEFDCDLPRLADYPFAKDLSEDHPVHCRFERKTFAEDNSRGFALKIVAKSTGEEIFNALFLTPGLCEQDFNIDVRGDDGQILPLENGILTVWNKKVLLYSPKTAATWSVNGAVVAENFSSITVEPSEQAGTLKIQATIELDGAKFYSNTVKLFNTQAEGEEAINKLQTLSQVAADFVAQNGIQTAFSIAVNTPDVDFAFNAGKTSLSTGDACNADTLHYFYSITKTFTAAMAHRLIDEGKISLDGKVSDYLDCANFDPILVEKNATIAQLLSHRSGMDEYADNFLIFAKNPFLTGEWNPALVLEFIKSPILGPGVYRYSTANYILLGMIIEKIAKKPLNDLLRENFFEPLDLNLSLCPQDDVDYNKVSHPHCYPGTVAFVLGGGTAPIDVTQALGGGFIPITGKTTWSGGGIVGNAPDAAKWVRALYEGDVLSEAAKTRIFSSMADYAEGMSGDDSFGLCGRAIFADGKKCYGSYGRSVGSNNLAFCCPEKKAGIAILTSCNENRDGKPNLDDLLSLLIAALPSK